MTSIREGIQKPSWAPRAGQPAVMRDLGRFGPGNEWPRLGLEDAFSYCKSLARQHYENFSVACWLVPKSMRQDMYNVYAFCRWSDDLGDETGDPHRSLELLNWWRSELRQCFHGQSQHPVFIALKTTIDRYHLDASPFEQLIDAFVQDQSVTRFSSDDDLQRYCTKSANPVGRILLGMAGVESEHANELSDHVCTGLQIANFCQDMKRDALINRIYLPQSRWEEYQLTEATILRAAMTKDLGRALADWMQVARDHLVRGLSLSRLCPLWLARDVQLFARGGLMILDNIHRQKCDVWSHSIQVTKLQKLRLIFQAVFFPTSTHVPPTRTQERLSSE